MLYLEETFNPDGKYAKAQQVVSKLLTLRVGADGPDKGVQTVVAVGPGEVRLLQPGSKDPNKHGQQPAPAAPQPGRPRTTAADDEQEMKLTIMTAFTKMVAVDKGKVFQEATFPDGGARVVQVPSTNLNQVVAAHDLPPRGVYLACSQVLKVSSTQTKKDAPPEQRMTAEGNGEFRTDDYEGVASVIKYEGQAVEFIGGQGGLARLYKRQSGVNNRDYHSGKSLTYHRNGTITGSGSHGMSYSSSP